MIEKKWDLNRISDQILLRAIQKRQPLACTLELTYRCNFHCRMCYARMSDAQAKPYGRLRTVDEWLEMAKQLLDAGVLYLNLTGGECTMYPDFVRLYEALSRMGFLITIMSNAGAYTDDIREIFRRYPPQNAAISLYGGSNEAYAAVTGDPEGLDKAVQNIRFLRSIGVPVRLNFTMIRQNAMDYPKVDRLCREFGLPFTMITDITGHQRDPGYSEALACRLTPAERACVACHPPEEIGLALDSARELEMELSSFRMPAAPDEEPVPEMEACIGALVSCVIAWNGEMQSCVSMNGYHSVYPFDVGFKAAWAQLKAEQAKTFCRPAVCQKCSMAADCLHNCAARRYEGTGSPHEPDPYTCQYTYLLRLYRTRHGGTDEPETPGCV